MKCEICNTELPQGVIRCSVCGYSHMSFIDADNTGAAAKMKDDFRRAKLRGKGIYLKCFDYTVSGGKVTEVETDPVKLADAQDLEMNIAKMCDTNFYGIRAGEKAQLIVYVGDEDRKEYTLDFTMKEDTDDLRIGVMLTDGLKLKFSVVGSSSGTQTSEISLI